VDASWLARTGWSAGDMYFVLPGPDGEPVETLRYEALRRAIQDYELLRLAECTLSAEKMATVSTAAFAQILRTMDVRDFAGVGRQQNGASAADLYSSEPEDYERAREIVLAAVDGGV
jgi:hypothetical protein